MRLKQLTLRNMRLFDEQEQTLTFAQDKNVTVLVGNNGSGKSTILDAIALEISAFVANFRGQSLKQFSDADVHIKENNSLSDYLKVDAVFGTTYNGDLEIIRTRQGSVKAPSGSLINVNDYADRLIGMVNANEPCILPIIAYYGTGRGQIKAPARKRDFQKIFTRWDGYTGSLEADTNFKRFIEWFDMMEDQERREREARRDFDYHSPILSAIRNALGSFVGNRFTNPRMLLSPLRFVMDEKVGRNKIRELRIEQMSDGYKIITAMVADIASRMAELNPLLEDPLSGTGIVLIDELDLHLHPKWQRIIIDSLTKTFRHIQFIVTTHSPIILSGALEKAQIIILDEHGQQQEVQASSYINYDISQLLLSDLFDLVSTRSPKWDALLKEQQTLLGKQNPSAEELERLKSISDRLSSLSIGDSLEAIRSRELVYAIAKKLGIEDA